MGLFEALDGAVDGLSNALSVELPIVGRVGLNTVFDILQVNDITNIAAAAERGDIRLEKAVLGMALNVGQGALNFIPGVGIAANVAVGVGSEMLIEEGLLGLTDEALQSQTQVVGFEDRESAIALIVETFGVTPQEAEANFEAIVSSDAFKQAAAANIEAAKRSQEQGVLASVEEGVSPQDVPDVRGTGAGLAI